jgi:hypothetical protein
MTDVARAMTDGVGLGDSPAVGVPTTKAKKRRKARPAPALGPCDPDAPTCSGVVRGADAPLPKALRAEIVQLLAAALVADFIEDSEGYGQSPQEK